MRLECFILHTILFVFLTFSSSIFYVCFRIVYIHIWGMNFVQITTDVQQITSTITCINKTQSKNTPQIFILELTLRDPTCTYTVI